MSIQDKLMAWGMGKAMNNATNGYPAKSTFARFILNAGDTTEKITWIPPLSDEEHIRLDAVISEMSSTRPLHFEVICLAYIQRKRDAAICKALKPIHKTSRSSIRGIRENAEHFIDGRLC